MNDAGQPGVRPAKIVRGGLAKLALLIALLLHSFGGADLVAEDGGKVAGKVTLTENGEPIHGAVVLIVGLGKFVLTDSEGRFEISSVPPGTYEVLAQREHLTAERKTVTVAAGQPVQVDFALSLSPVHESITVTGTAAPATLLEAFNSVTSLDSVDLVRDPAGTLGEILQAEPGIARRSFGPGNSRPIIRGFDGDRVLIMQDGIRTGDLSSQSGDHGVSIDPGSLERIEVVKGPATLLYGSNALGGVVNAITPHEAHRRSPAPGLRGQFTADGGTANDQAALNGSIQYSHDRWMLWAGGGGRRTGDYNTPLGEIENSATRLSGGAGGFGFSADKAFFSLGYQIEDGRYGIPFAGEFHGHAGEGEESGEGGAEEEVFVDLATRRQAVRADLGLRNLANRALDSFRLVLNYIDWQHNELEIDEGIENVGTTFDNETFVVRAELDQKKTGRLSGKLGLESQFRDFTATGEEALAPATLQRAIAGFAYEELDFGRYRLQFGGRVEYNDYQPEERVLEVAHDAGEAEDHNGEEGLEPGPVRDRSFTGFSGSAGLHLKLGSDSVLVANFTRSYRAPALEELYNFGPHVGNLAFEIGNPDLERESAIGVDLSLRHQAARARGEFNVYYYDIGNFVFPAFSGQVEDGLPVAQFVQGDSRFVGFDGKGSFRLHEYAWLAIDAGYTSAELADTREPLPRIPPFHGRVSLEVPYNGLSIKPELVWSAEQNRVFRSETSTGGWTVVNVSASYILARGHAAHIFSVKGYNLTDELYRNHTSFIKDLAPEVGRGVKFSYSLRFF